MRLGRGSGVGPPVLTSAVVALCLALHAPILHSQPAPSPDSAPDSDQAVAVDPEAAMVVGPRAAVGTDTAGEKAADTVVGGVLGSVFGNSDRKGRPDRPDTERDPTRKLDYVDFEALNGGLETGARAQWTGEGLLVSARIDDAPGKGTFQAVFLQACNGPRLYPSRYEIYKLWGEGGVSIGWSSGTMRDGEVIEQDSGTIAGQWDDGVGHDEWSSGPGTWRQLGFDKAHHGARQIGAYFDLAPAELEQFEDARLFLHTTLPSQDPVTTTASVWTISPGADESVVLGATEYHPDGWWGHCNGWAAAAPVGVPNLTAEREDDDVWNVLTLASAEAKVIGDTQTADADTIQLTEAESTAAPDNAEDDPGNEEGAVADNEEACGSIAGTVTTNPEKLRKAIKNIVVYVDGECEFCPPKPEHDPVEVEESEAGIHPSFFVVPKGTKLKLINAHEKDIDFGPEFIPSPFDQDPQPTHSINALSKGKSTEVTPTKSPSKSWNGDYVLKSRWFKRYDARMFVTPNQCYAIADEDGYYSIGELPPGTYRLKVYTWVRRTYLPQADVTVKEGEVTIKDFVLNREKKEESQ